MKIIIAAGRIFRHGLKTLKKGEGETKYICTFTNHRLKASGGWTTDYHNIYMPPTDEFIDKFHDAISYEMVKSKDVSPQEADELSAIVVVQGEFSMNVYAGKGSATIYVQDISQVAVIKSDNDWFKEDEASIINQFITYGPEGFEDGFISEGDESDG